jgi:hypothetical protein
MINATQHLLIGKELSSNKCVELPAHRQSQQIFIFQNLKGAKIGKLFNKQSARRINIDLCNLLFACAGIA